METENNRQHAAPYLPFKTFLGAVETLELGLPARVDRTIWRSQSGLNQGLIMAAFRFFALVDENDTPTAALRRLVEAKANRKAEMASLISGKYRTLIEHDLTKLTPRLLEEAIGEYGVSGSTKQKATAFFLQAAKSADLPLSPFLQNQVRTVGARKRRTLRRTDSAVEIDAVDLVAEQTGVSGATRTLTLRSGGTVRVSVDANYLCLDKIDRKFLDDLTDAMHSYEANAGAQ